MPAHHHKHAHEGKASSHHKIDWTRLHKDWRAWLVIGLMLAAMGAYVLTLDDSIQPGSAVQGGTPATAAPASPPG